MKKLLFAAVALCVLAATARDASADGIPSPFYQGAPKRGMFFKKHPVPAFQAAPWYSYWPYTSHFQTPSPLQGAFYAPPYGGGGMMNPYFPAHGGAMPVIPVPPGGGR